MKSTIKNQNIKNSASNIIDAVFLPFAALLVTPFFINHLGIKEYGLWMLINSIIASFSILNFGGSNVAIKYISSYRKESNTVKINEVFSTLFIFQILLGLIIAAAILLGTELILKLDIFDIDKNSAHIFKYVTYLGSGIFIIKLLEQIITGYLKGYERFDIASIFSITSKLFALIAQVITVALGGNLFSIFLNTLITLTLLLFMQMYGLKYFNKKICFLKGFNRNTLIRMLGFSGWSWLLSSTMIIVAQLDKWVIGSLAGLQTLGYYSIAYLILNHTHMILSSSVAWIFPKVSKLGITDDTTKLFFKAHSFVVVASSLISLILLNSQSLFLLWLGQETYHNTENLIKLILVVSPIYSLSILSFYYVNGTGLIKHNFYNAAFTGILRIILMFSLYNILGTPGIIYSIGISSLIMTFHYFWVIKNNVAIPNLNIFFFLAPVTIYSFLSIIITNTPQIDNVAITTLYAILIIFYYYTYRQHLNLNFLKEK